jgi:hypothetical protein
MNMCLDLKNYTIEISKKENIHQIETKSDAFEFANIATESFSYKVDGTIVYNLCKDRAHFKLFIYREKKTVMYVKLFFLTKVI